MYLINLNSQAHYPCYSTNCGHIKYFLGAYYSTKHIGHTIYFSKIYEKILKVFNNLWYASGLEIGKFIVESDNSDRIGILMVNDLEASYDIKFDFEIYKLQNLDN